MEANLDLTEAQRNRLNQLNELDEKCTTVVHQTELIQQQRSRWHDQFIKKKVLCEGDQELLYDSRFKRDFKSKMRTRWSGPYQIDRVFDNGTVHLITIDEDRTPLFINGHMLQLYHKPISRDAFISQVAADPGYQLKKGQECFSIHVNI